MLLTWCAMISLRWRGQPHDSYLWWSINARLPASHSWHHSWHTITYALFLLMSTQRMYPGQLAFAVFMFNRFGMGSISVGLTGTLFPGLIYLKCFTHEFSETDWEQSFQLCPDQNQLLKGPIGPLRAYVLHNIHKQTAKRPASSLAAAFINQLWTLRNDLQSSRIRMFVLVRIVMWPSWNVIYEGENSTTFRVTWNLVSCMWVYAKHTYIEICRRLKNIYWTDRV